MTALMPYAKKLCVLYAVRRDCVWTADFICFH